MSQRIEEKVKTNKPNYNINHQSLNHSNKYRTHFDVFQKKKYLISKTQISTRNYVS